MAGDDWGGIGEELKQSESSKAEKEEPASLDEIDGKETSDEGHVNGDTRGGTADKSTTKSGGQPEADSEEEHEPKELNLEQRLQMPGFEYDECKQGGLHPRESQWRTYETARAMANGMLAQKGLTKVEKRELDDALLRLANEYHEELARLVIESRGIDPQEID